MAVDVEVWDQHPESDRDDWQQVSEGNLVVPAEELLRIDSPTSEQVTCAVPQGNYTVEVSGRGFITHGWPGSTEPGDTWRIRLWPNDGQRNKPPKLWDESAAPDTPPQDDIGLGPEHNLPDFTPEQSRESPIVAAIQHFAGAVLLFGVDPEIITTITQRPNEVQQEIALWAAQQACICAGISEHQWVSEALAETPHSGSSGLDERYRDIRRQPDPTQPDVSPGLLFSFDTPDQAFSAKQAYGTNVLRHRPAFAVTALIAAAKPNTLQAAVETIHCAGMTFGNDFQSLLTKLRILLGPLP